MDGSVPFDFAISSTEFLHWLMTRAEFGQMQFFVYFPFDSFDSFVSGHKVMINRKQLMEMDMRSVNNELSLNQ